MTMSEKIKMLIGEFQKRFNAIPENIELVTPTHIRILADLASVIDTAMDIDEAGYGNITHKGNYNFEDCIIDELSSAEQKLEEYLKHNDPALLNMAKDEMRHAAYYISHAKMSNDPNLVNIAKGYQEKYNKIEAKLTENYM